MAGFDEDEINDGVGLIYERVKDPETRALAIERYRADVTSRADEQDVARETYSGMHKAQQQADRLGRRATTYGKAVEQTHAQVDAGPLGNMFLGGKPLPGQTARTVDQARRLGAMSVTNTPGEAYSDDLEGALEQPDSELVPRGDSLAVLNSTGDILAVRKQFPNLWDHATSLGDEGGGSVLGTIGNTFDMGTRPLAAIYARMVAELTGDEERLEGANLLRDVGYAAVGEQGDRLEHSLRGGGLVPSSLGTGWGSAMRYASQRLLTKNADATFGDLIKWHGGMGPDSYDEGTHDVINKLPIMGAFIATFDRPLSDFEDADWEFLGLMAGIPLDALNFIPVTKVGKLLGKALKPLTWGASYLGDLMRGTRLGAKILPQTTSMFQKVYRAAGKGDEEALRMAEQTIQAPQAAAGTVAVHKQIDAPEIMRAVGMMRKGETRQVMEAMEDMAYLRDGDVVKRLGALDNQRYGGLAVEEQRAIDIMRSFDDEAIELLNATDDMLMRRARHVEVAINDASTKFIADNPEIVDLRKWRDDGTLEMALGPAKYAVAEALLRKAARHQADEMVAAAREVTKSPFADTFVPNKRIDAMFEGMDSADDFRKLNKLSRREFERVSKMKGDHAFKAAPGLQQAHRLSLKTGVDLAGKHGDGYTKLRPGLQQAATILTKTLARSLEMAQVAGVFPAHMRAGGYVPHILKGAKSYDMTQLRAMVGSEDLVDLRRGAQTALEKIEAENALKADGIVMNEAGQMFFMGRPVKDVDEATKMMEEMGKGPGDLLQEFLNSPIDRQLELRKDVREALFPGARPPRDIWSESNRYAGTRIEGEETLDDIKKIFGKYSDSLMPRVQRGLVAKNIVRIKDASGRPVARRLQTIIAEQNPELAARVIGENGNLIPHRAFTKASKKGRTRLTNEIQHAVDKAGYQVLTKQLTDKFPALDGLLVPTAVRRELELLLGNQVESTADAIFAVIGKAHVLWVPLLLATPGFHVRNAAYGMGQVQLYAGMRAFAPGNVAAAHRVAAMAEHGAMSSATIEGLRLADLSAEMTRQGLIETGRLADYERFLSSGAAYKGARGQQLLARVNPASEGSLPALFKRTINRPLTRGMGLGGKIGDGKDLARLRAADAGEFVADVGRSATIENFQRAQVYITLRREGMSETQAAEQVVKALFDYTGMRLSAFEKNMRQLFPFYQWLRYSNVQIIDAMAHQPRRFAGLDRFYRMMVADGEWHSDSSSRDPYDLPEYVREKAPGHVPEWLKPAMNKARERIGIKDLRPMAWTPERVGGMAFNPFREPGKQLAGQLGLVPKAIAERGTGKYLFGGGDISPGYDPATAAPGERVLGTRYEDALGYYLPMLGGPWANLAVSSGALQGVGVKPRVHSRHPGVEQDEAMLYTLMSMLTGNRFTPYDPEAVHTSRDMRVEEMFKALAKARRAEGVRDLAGNAPLQRIFDNLTGETE
jgi:hypothetical protein